MRVLIAGASGLIGRAVTESLRASGHEVIPLKRSTKIQDSGEPWWDPSSGRIDLSGAGKLDAVICFSGENLTAGRWTAKKKEELWNSRVKTTELLSETLAKMEQPPEVFIAASAIGFYGDRGSQEVSEESPAGSGFLASLCQEWEAATTAAKNAGIRTVNLRIGVVMSRKGGALKRMWTPFSLGAGGVLGSGEQMVSWIALEDLVEAIKFVLTHKDISGPVNGTAPNPVTNYELTKTLGSVMRRPTFMWMPALMARLVFGEMGDEVLLRGAKVMPSVLRNTGYSFKYPKLREALENA